MTATERTAAKRFLMKRLTLNHTEGKLLKPLLKPIVDTIREIGGSNVASSHVLPCVINEMARSGRSFWKWDRSNWLSFSKEVLLARHGLSRLHLLALSYSLGGQVLVFELYSNQAVIVMRRLAHTLLGKEAVETSINRVNAELTRIGYHLPSENGSRRYVERCVAILLLLQRSPRLEDITAKTIESLRASHMALTLKKATNPVSRALEHMGLLNVSIVRFKQYHKLADGDVALGIPKAWRELAIRWKQTSTLSENSRTRVFHNVVSACRWLQQVRPEIMSPKLWTRDLCIEFIAAVDTWRVGDYPPRVAPKHGNGQPLRVGTKYGIVSAMRIFFRDIQDFGWIPVQFDPTRAFPTPAKWKSQLGPNPRVIPDDQWAKLMWAGLNLCESDLPQGLVRGKIYPFAMIKAFAILWLFSGLRSNEICRLRVGCVRWDPDKATLDLITGGTVSPICFLEVPVNKTGASFVKPVDRIVGEAITDWERSRPEQRPQLDRKTGAMVDFLFMHRGRAVQPPIINATIIPALCKKAGIPTEDRRGPFSSHRARATIASQLYNAKDPMPFYDLKAWLGHASARSTEYYINLTPKRLARSFSDANYFRRNVRTIEVLIDKDVVKSGAALKGEPYIYYDLGHGFCSNDFFSQCQHRMACARCGFYVPKDSAKGQLLESLDNNHRMAQDIPLTDEEQEAVSGDTAAVKALLDSSETCRRQAARRHDRSLHQSASRLRHRYMRHRRIFVKWLGCAHASYRAMSLGAKIHLSIIVVRRLKIYTPHGREVLRRRLEDVPCRRVS